MRDENDNPGTTKVRQPEHREDYPSASEHDDTRQRKTFVRLSPVEIVLPIVPGTMSVGTLTQAEYWAIVDAETP